MASFLVELFESIFTPGPNRTLIVATNATFGALQLLLGILLLATRSVHFVVLSILCAGLWWSINWFAQELEAAKTSSPPSEGPAAAKGGSPAGQNSSGEDTETERETPSASWISDRAEADRLAPDAADTLRRRRSLGDGAGEVSTEDEWEKVSEAGGAKDR